VETGKNTKYFIRHRWEQKAALQIEQFIFTTSDGSKRRKITTSEERKTIYKDLVFRALEFLL
jgi:hypothetical protein